VLVLGLDLFDYLIKIALELTFGVRLGNFCRHFARVVSTDDHGVVMYFYFGIDDGTEIVNLKVE
jgi:hypothetical protein